MRQLTWATRVTLLRIFLVTPFILLFLDLGHAPARWKRLTLVVLFAGIALTDMLDGFLARRFAQATRLGRILDPIADKLLILSAMILLVAQGVPADDRASLAATRTLPAWVLAVALAKDVAVVAGCLVVYVATRHLIVNPRLTGKACTFFQMLMVVVMLLSPDLPASPDPPRAAWTLAGGLAILATIDYTVAWLRSRCQRRAPAGSPTQSRLR